MKKVIYCIAGLSLALAACDKDNNDVTNTPVNTIVECEPGTECQ